MLFDKLPYFILALAALAAGAGHLADLFIAMRSRFHGFQYLPFCHLLAGADDLFRVHRFILLQCMRDTTSKH